MAKLTDEQIDKRIEDYKQETKFRPQDLEAINKFKELFAAEIEAQDKLIEHAKKENQKNAESN